MSGVRELLTRARGVFHADAAGRLDEEMAAHTEMLADEYMARGMSQEEARAAARRELGNVTALRQTYREQSGLPWAENFWLDLKYAVRTLSRNASFTAACLVTLTVGLGAMITVLSVVSAFLWRPLPYPDSMSLVALKESDPRNSAWTFSEPTLLDVQERARSLSAVGAFRTAEMAMTGVAEPESLRCASVTPSFLKMTAVEASFGESQAAVVISRELWRRKWAMDPGVVGRAIALDGVSYTIAGVAELPDDLLPGVELLVPLTPRSAESRSAHDLDVIARLRPGVSVGQAQAELADIGAAIGKENPRTNAGWSVTAIPLKKYLVGPGTSRMMWMILAAVALLWLLACANVAGLQLARSVSRRHEMGTRMALGASRGRLLAQTFTESLLLACAGAVLGTGAAEFALEAIRSVGAASWPKLAHLQLDANTAGMALACMLGSAVIFGLAGRAPANQTGRELTRRNRGRDLLIVAQVALACILLVGATLLFQSFLQLRAVNPGYDVTRLLSVRLERGVSGQDDAHRVQFVRRVGEEVASLPAVEAVGASNVTPFSGQGTGNRFRIPGEPGLEYHSAGWRAVTPGFFKALGIPLKRGRLFSEADGAGALEVVIVNESMARKYWPGEDAVGKQLLWGRSESVKTIVGVIGDLRDLAVDASPEPMMFRPFAQLSEAPMTLLVRTRLEPGTAIQDIRKRIWSGDPDVALEFRPVTEAMANSIVRPRASFMAVSLFAAVAMMVAAFGLFGLISYRVNQRQQEIGLRLALGVQRNAVRWSVQRRCLNLVCCGLALGLPVAFAASRWLSSLLYETRSSSPVTYAAVAGIFLIVALAASFGPALKASRLDPAAALRHE